MKLKLLLATATLSLAFAATAQNITITNANGTVEVYAPVNVASTNPPTSGWLNTIKYLGNDLSSASNYSADAYGTYAPHAPQNKIGGGVLLIYDVSSHVGVAVGIDYLGGWSMFSGNATFKLPFEPLAGWGLTNFVVIPNAIVGIGTSLSGAGNANGNVTTIAGTGASFQFGHLWGGRFNSGGEAVNIGGAGPYSGWDYRIFIGWSKGF